MEVRQDQPGQDAAGDRVAAEDVEGLIGDLAGVLGARIVVNEWGGIREVHVLADTSRPAKSIVRDVESGLYARWGLVVDHKRVSVAQLTSVPRRPRWVRLRIRRLTVTSDPGSGGSEALVQLSLAAPRDLFGRPVVESDLPEEVWEGCASGTGADGTPLRLTAAATVAALNQALTAGHAFALEDAGRFRLGARELAAVVVRYRAPRGLSQLLSGSALVERGGADAGVRAALAATNRIMALALRRRGESDDAPQPDTAPWDEAGEAEAAAAAESLGDELGRGA